MSFCSLAGVKAIYCHATSKDGAQADPAGEVRAERLAKAAASSGVEHIVYNSSGITCPSGRNLRYILVCHDLAHKFYLETLIVTTFPETIIPRVIVLSYSIAALACTSQLTMHMVPIQNNSTQLFIYIYSRNAAPSARMIGSVLVCRGWRTWNFSGRTEAQH